MSKFVIDFSSWEAFRDRLNDLPQQLEQTVDAELYDGAQAIAAEAKQRAPADDGILRNEIGVDKLKSMDYLIFCRAAYSPFVEFGTRTLVDVPPGVEEYAIQFKGMNLGSSVTAWEAIKTWCIHKGIEEQFRYAVFLKIMNVGVTPHPFFFPAVNRILPIIKNRVIAALSGSAFK